MAVSPLGHVHDDKAEGPGIAPAEKTRKASPKSTVSLLGSVGLRSIVWGGISVSKSVHHGVCRGCTYQGSPRAVDVVLVLRDAQGASARRATLVHLTQVPLPRQLECMADVVQDRVGDGVKTLARLGQDCSSLGLGTLVSARAPCRCEQTLCKLT